MFTLLHTRKSANDNNKKHEHYWAYFCIPINPRRTKIDYNYLSIPYKKNNKRFLKDFQGKKRSPSDSTSKTGENTPGFISLRCHLVLKMGKEFFQKKGWIRTPFKVLKGLCLCFPLAIQSERHVQGQAINVDLSQIHPLQPECQPLKEGW